MDCVQAVSLPLVLTYPTRSRSKEVNVNPVILMGRASTAGFVGTPIFGRLRGRTELLRHSDCRCIRSLL